MEVGAVEYQLCPLNLNCEKCDFYKKMSQGCHQASEPDNGQHYITFQKPKAEYITFQAGYQYLSGHFWFKHIAKNQVLIGMDDILWKMVCPPKGIILTDPGTQIQKGSCFAWILIPHGIIFLKMPFSGLVLYHNQELFQSEFLGDLRHTSCEDKWFLALEVKENELQSINSLTKQEYTECVLHDCEKIYETVNNTYSALSPPSDNLAILSEPKAERLILEKHNFIELLKKTTLNQATIR
jgi:glycine cleavage system H lipoate-binding protein